MKISKQSPLTGKINEMEIPITEADYQKWQNRRAHFGNKLVHEVFPGLTAAQREFLMTGYTQEDWDAMFPPEDE